MISLRSTEQLFLDTLYIDVSCIMITYTISSNFCKKRFSASIPPGYFYWRFLFYFISTEKWNKKRKYPNGAQVFTFQGSLIKRQTSDTSSDNEWCNEWCNERQRMTTINNKWQRVTTNDNERQRVVVLANFLFPRIREEPTAMHPKEIL